MVNHQKISPAAPVGAAQSSGDAILPLRSGSLEKQRARLLPALHHVGTHFELVQTRAEAYPRIAGSLLDRFYRYIWPGPPEHFLLVRAIHDNCCNAVLAFGEADFLVRCGRGTRVAWVDEWNQWRDYPAVARLSSPLAGFHLSRISSPEQIPQ